MRTFNLNGRYLSEEELKAWPVDELELLLIDIQAEMHSLAKQRDELQNLPPNKKNPSTWSKVSKLKSRMMYIQDCQAWIGFIKKQKKSSLSRERDFYKAFFNMCKNNLRHGLFLKLETKTKEASGITPDWL